MTLETLLIEINERGWLVNNLFQRANGMWQANLRSPTHSTEFAFGTTPLEALSLCIDLIESAEALIDQPATYSIEPARSLADILTNLLPKQKIERRI